MSVTDVIWAIQCGLLILGTVVAVVTLWLTKRAGSAKIEASSGESNDSHEGKGRS